MRQYAIPRLMTKLLLPLILLLGLLILLTDGPPLLYREQRLGRHGKLFPFYKFRTLRPDTAGARRR